MINENKKLLWKMENIGDDSFIGGLFVATKEEVSQLFGKMVNFGEADGKHSRVRYRFDEDDFEMISDDERFISDFKKLIGNDYGYNPIEYYKWGLEEDGE